MTYSAPFLKMVVTGSLFGVESFSWGINLINDFGGGVAPTEVPQAVITAVETFHASGAHVGHDQAKLTTLKLNEIGTDGRYVSASDTVRYDWATPYPGVGSTQLPPQVALAISLVTDAARGRASAGRFYVPVGIGVSSDGRLPSSAQQSAATAATALLNSLNTALPGFTVGVVSSVGTGTQRVATGVRVGRVLDTMRSRRRALVEDYYEAPALAT